MICVDKLKRRTSNRQWCHLFDDQNDLNSLHDFAWQIGLKKEWFQSHPRHPHYDVTPGKRQQAIKNGAIEVERYRQKEVSENE